MATVKFNDTDEFIEELRRDADAVDRKVLRLTFRYRLVDPSPMQSMAVVASAVIAGHVVELEDRCGTFFQQTREADEVRAAAKKRADAIRVAAEELGLEVRSGVFEGK